MSKNQLRVATRVSTSPKEKEKRIINLVNGHEEGISPKVMYNYIKNSGNTINYNTIRSICIRLVRIGKIKKHPKNKGYYTPVEDSTHNLFETNIHNLILTYKLKENGEIHERISDKREDLGTITTNFGIGLKSKQATMHFSTNYPFNISSLSLCVDSFKKNLEIFAEIKNIPNNEIYIATIEFNKDSYGTRLEGIKAITIENMLTSFKAYQKDKNRARIEIKTKIPFTTDVLFSILESNFYQADIINSIQQRDNEIKEIKKQIALTNSKNKLIMENQLTISKNHANKNIIPQNNSNIKLTSNEVGLSSSLKVNEEVPSSQITSTIKINSTVKENDPYPETVL